MRKNILIAFLLNLFFSVFEAIGGFITGSVAILSDSLHDLGDALSIGIAVALEKKSTKKPDSNYTYGYLRYSVLGSVITTCVLTVGSLAVIINSVSRILNPTPIDYNGMIIFAIIGAVVNFLAAFVTHSGHSLNEKAVNLHMLEDVLGWIVVLVGAVVMKFTNFALIDPIMSMGVAIFILINAVKNLKEVLDIFLDKVPKGIETDKIKQEILVVEGVEGVHHIHVTSLDGEQNIATLHVVAQDNFAQIKAEVKHKLEHLGVAHATVEMETPEEHCPEHSCDISPAHHGACHHHH